MVEFFRFVAENPWMTVFLAVMVLFAIKAIGNGVILSIREIRRNKEG